ncbi:neutral zinc metallopeptidase [Nannocystis sp. ILAH1]|uniref:KPN_02809 family neutral zinc metallopeptidase n=1 Tax=unclassified Nannocystis TaxID=2627009 RepID=UPI00226FFE5C|nr:MULTISPECIES: neutral zinc metallopeptidase [unclassified Nannocystis]MCY0993265.1 neutral zinc metallopeptidase [Nannocystis sp. ILAH1]MCY1063302.1 neutral zinc metallopeptidase [Nannocystis sp. RBIL2]
MRFEKGYRSDDVIDRRGQRSFGGGGGGGGAMLGLVGVLLRSRFGWIGVILMLVLYATMGRCEQQGSYLAGQQDAPVAADKADDLSSYVAYALDDVQGSWLARSPIAVSGAGPTPYQKAKLVLFTDRTPTGCGYGDAASGPFYCPADQRVYIDLGFYRELRDRLGATGDFAQAYVIAHEVAHHVQNLLGLSDKVHAASPRQLQGAGGLSVRLELQADCLAGVWARDAELRGKLDPGDIEEAMRAAEAIGDDRLQKMARGTVQPESFSHGTSQQRARWFARGHDSHDPAKCDTFGAAEL